MSRCTGDVASRARAARLEEFDREYGHRLRAVARRRMPPAAAEDLVHDVYAALLAARRRDPLGLPSDELWSYACTVAHNLAASYHRSPGARRVQLADTLPDQSAPVAEQPDMAAIASALANEVTAALGALTEPERAAFLLCHYFGVPAREGAALLRTDVTKLKGAAHRARAKLRKRIAGFLGIGPLLMWRPLRRSIFPALAVPATLAGLALFVDASPPQRSIAPSVRDWTERVPRSALASDALLGDRATVTPTSPRPRPPAAVPAERDVVHRATRKLPPPCLRGWACIDSDDPDLRLQTPAVGPVPRWEIGLSGEPAQRGCGAGMTLRTQAGPFVRCG